MGAQVGVKFRQDSGENTKNVMGPPAPTGKSPGAQRTSCARQGFGNGAKPPSQRAVVEIACRNPWSVVQKPFFN
jgi:hypothetical protein